MAQKIDASRLIIGKYEHNENLPAIEMVAKMAQAFGVTVDFLIGSGENASYDKETVEYINDIQKMNADTKNVLFKVIDTYIQNFKTKKLSLNNKAPRRLCCYNFCFAILYFS